MNSLIVFFDYKMVTLQNRTKTGDVLNYTVVCSVFDGCVELIRYNTQSVIMTVHIW